MKFNLKSPKIIALICIIIIILLICGIIIKQYNDENQLKNSVYSTTIIVDGKYVEQNEDHNSIECKIVTNDGTIYDDINNPTLKKDNSDEIFNMIHKNETYNITATNMTMSGNPNIITITPCNH